MLFSLLRQGFLLICFICIILLIKDGFVFAKNKENETEIKPFIEQQSLLLTDDNKETIEKIVISSLAVEEETNSGFARNQHSFINILGWTCSLITVVLYIVNCLFWPIFIAPKSWQFERSVFGQQLVNTNKQLRLYKQRFVLQPDREWANSSVYPLVHQNVPDYTPPNYVKQLSLPGSILFVIAESFNPFPLLTTAEFIQNNSNKERLLNKDLVPTLNSLSLKGLVFPNIFSTGQPTIFGWQHMFTGEISPFDRINMISSLYNDFDDLGSYLKQYGYWNIYQSAFPPEFDGQQQFLYRGNKQIYGNQKLEKPRWFDEVQYVLTQDQTSPLSYSFSKGGWIPDRITSAVLANKIIKTRLTQQKVFSVWAPLCTHAYFTFDSSYTSKFDQSVSNIIQIKSYIQMKWSKGFVKMAQYFDYYLQQMIQKLDDTLIIIVGDHGSIITPLFEQNESIFTKYQIFPSCANSTYSLQERFNTLGLISYTGNESSGWTNFLLQFNEIYLKPVTNHDFIYTIQKLIADIQGKTFRTSRQGRDLLQLLEGHRNNQKNSAFIQFIQTGTEFIVVTESSTKRVGWLYQARGRVFNETTFPICFHSNFSFANYSRREVQKDQKLYFFISNLIKSNRFYNYQFRDILFEDYEMLKPDPPYKNWIVRDVFWQIFVSLTIFFVINCSLHLILLSVLNLCKTLLNCNKIRNR